MAINKPEIVERIEGVVNERQSDDTITATLFIGNKPIERHFIGEEVINKFRDAGVYFDGASFYYVVERIGGKTRSRIEAITDTEKGSSDPNVDLSVFDGFQAKH